MKKFVQMVYTVFRPAAETEGGQREDNRTCSLRWTEVQDCVDMDMDDDARTGRPWQVLNTHARTHALSLYAARRFYGLLALLGVTFVVDPSRVIFLFLQP